MNRTPLSIPEIALIGGTRAALGFGVGLLVADRLNHDQRRAVGWTLVAVGAITTIPIAAQLFSAQRDAHGEQAEARHGRFVQQDAP
jgi:hypothetical protein